MIATEDGGYLMLGESYHTDSNVLIHYGGMTADLWILKVDGSGDKVWSKVIGGTDHESGAVLVQGPGGGCYVVGGTGSNDHDCTGNHGGGDAYIARLDKDGNIIWHSDLGGSHMDVATSACSNSNGGIIIVAQTTSDDGDVHNYHGNSDYWVVEIDENSNIIWSNCYGTAGYEVPLAICKATDGSIWINGFSADDIADNAYIVHSDNIGNFLSSTVLGSTGQDHGQLIAPLNGGTVIAGGYYYINDKSFSSIPNYGYIDAFLAIFAPWTTVVAEERISSSGITVFPNPTTDVIKLLATEQCSVRIIDMTGREMAAVELNGRELHIDVGRWARGIYYVQVARGNGIITNKKVVLNR